jgi:S1-C subfamily serine protease
VENNSASKTKWVTCGVIALFVLCIGIIVMAGSFALITTWLDLAPTAENISSVIEITDIPTDEPQIIVSDPIQSVIPFEAVVQILALVDENGRYEIGWTGSGSIISADGYILTNAHVVLSDVNFEVEKLVIAVTIEEDQLPVDKYYAEVLQANEQLDIAVIRIITDLDGNSVDYETLFLPFVKIGNADDLYLGDSLTILGYPGIGGDTITLTRGEVSGFTAEAESGKRAFIKTSGTIAGGNSGGLVANSQGQLIGIPTQLGYGGDDQFVDCRVLADTNRDGVVNENDSCVPTGGFINALRPINLALPLIKAAQSGEVEIVAQEYYSLDDELPTAGDFIFSDDFSNENSGWGKWDGENASSNYFDGSYSLSIKSENYYGWTIAGVNQPDVIIEVDTKILNSVGDGGYGLICRYQDEDNFYGFEISEDGYYAIWKYIDGEQVFLRGWTRSPKLNDTFSQFEIKVVCDGDKLLLSVDNQVFSTVIDTSFNTGDVGMLGGTFENSGFEISFDNYVVTVPQD